MRSSSTLPHQHSGSLPPTPTKFLNASDTDEEERGDLISFYNLVFLKKVRSFALRFAGASDISNTPKLSPLPSVRCLKASPRRVSANHHLYISPHNEIGEFFRGGINFSINISPSNALQAINRMIKANTAASKRVLALDGDQLTVDSGDNVSSPAKKICFSHTQYGKIPFTIVRRLQGLQTVIENQ